jgi:hypothetical protein
MRRPGKARTSGVARAAAAVKGKCSRTAAAGYHAICGSGTGGYERPGGQGGHLLGQRFDYVTTLCDRVQEVCPEFPGHPRHIHWSIPDPAASGGSDEATHPAFHATAADLEIRIEFLLCAIAVMPSQSTAVELP